ncbi:MAG: UDP-N-acetylmuramoyl-tripeptide--D-alanyl-D-alanine ligase [Planctomycetota bacterium]|nr:MAG: UDP-N-acetylmuramoyl-tripeptide--D-alanyl-D-alanine ligase [Planctomycetota bacterium]REK30134.1 MAG: UDP-N-acetylmuramoyl-tripeptide--D-alanyl-D-alanine ligase [Planctomycetota bacterium]REK37644.1 MAG: UDP-N-acetylmuramoyl-tripeptide--D-alanyl-D-alanine ligase [Planctomycetota bacterium]
MPVLAESPSQIPASRNATGLNSRRITSGGPNSPPWLRHVMQSVTLNELVAATSGKPVGISDAERSFDRIETDSRRVRRGDLFWALRGDRHDGHDFLHEAHSRGALASIVAAERRSDALGPAVIVNDTLHALWDFAAWHRRRLESLVIAITGSVGKTSTRHMLASTLSIRFEGAESPQNFNNHFGVPLSLCSIESHHEFAAIELGASAVGEIARLAALAQPEVGVVTAVAPAHLDGFGTIDDVCTAKGELIEAIPESGFAVINGDDERARSLANRARCPVLFAGERAGNDVVARRIEIDNDRLRFHVDRSRFMVHAAGRHFLTSAVLTVAVAREIGMDDADIAAGLAKFRPMPGRCRVSTIGPWTVIDDTYNASPQSMHAACHLLRDWKTTSHRILVVGDMRELGHESEHYHQQLGIDVARNGIDRLVALGAQAATVAGSAKQAGMDAGCLGACHDLDTLAVLLDCWLEPGDVVLVKGSRAMRMETVVESLQQLATAHKKRIRSRKAA